MGTFSESEDGLQSPCFELHVWIAVSRILIPVNIRLIPEREVKRAIDRPALLAYSNITH